MRKQEETGAPDRVFDAAAVAVAAAAGKEVRGHDGVLLRSGDRCSRSRRRGPTC